MGTVSIVEGLPEVKRAPRRVDGYVRVSRVGDRAGAAFISPDEQRDLIEKWAALRSVEIVGWETDLDQSGGTQDRPGLRRIMRRIEDREVDGVVVAKLDRFARNVWEAGADILTIRKAQGHLVSVQEGIDPTTEFGEFALTLMLAIAKLERDQRSAGWKGAKARAVARGAHIGPTPTGMIRGRSGDEAGKLLVDPAWAPVLRGLFVQAGVVRTNTGLAALMNGENPRPDGRAWTAPTIRNVLRNRVYVGEVHYRYVDGPHHEHVDAHESVVDEQTWQAAQREPGEQYRRAGSPAVLASLVRCAACRHRMSTGPGGTGGTLRVYRCSRTHASGRCPAPALVSGGYLEAWVLERVREAAADRRYQGAPELSADAGELRDALDAAQRELERFVADTELEAAVGPEAWRTGVLSRTAVRDTAQEACEATPAPSGDDDVLVTLGDMLDDLEPDELAEVYRASIDTIFIRRVPRGSPLDSKALILWSGDAPDDLPGRGRGNSGPLREFAWPEGSKAHAGMPPPKNAQDRVVKGAKSRARGRRRG